MHLCVLSNKCTIIHSRISRYEGGETDGTPQERWFNQDYRFMGQVADRASIHAFHLLLMLMFTGGIAPSESIRQELQSTHSNADS